jgi:type I restriction enzyme, S subunit
VTRLEVTNGLPDGWTVAALADIADCRLGKMLDQQKNLGALRPYLRNTNVQWGRIDLDDIKEMRIEDHERDKYVVLPGDLLICEGGEPGRCAVWREDREMYLQKALHRVRPGEGISPDYIRWWFQNTTSNGGLDDLFTGSTIKHLPARQLARVPIPVPPAAEQQRIAERLDDFEHSRGAAAIRLQSACATLDRFRSAARPRRARAA